MSPRERDERDFRAGCRDERTAEQENEMTDQFRIIGQLEAQMDSHSERLDRIETKLDVLTEYIQQQKGGARLVWAIAGAGGIVGACMSKLGALALAFLTGKP